MRTDGDDAEAHGNGVLDGQVTKTSTGTGEDDPVTDLGVRVLDGTVNCDTLRTRRQIRDRVVLASRLTAQRMDAASWDERPSGMGET